MKILLACLNVNGLGGSELFHYELAREFKINGLDFDLFTIRPPDPQDQVRIRLTNLGINQIHPNTINKSTHYDLIIASQPEVNHYCLNNLSYSRFISIIHSEIRSETPILDSRISKYIGIRKPIIDMLNASYGINNTELIYNPIDTSRYYASDNKFEKATGIFVGEVLDPIRTRAIDHLVSQCIELDYNLIIMSESYKDYNHKNISYYSKIWNNEDILKRCHFTGGILLGRTTLEGLCCNIPGYVYNIDQFGNVNSLELIGDFSIKNECDSKNVFKKYLNLINI